MFQESWTGDNCAQDRVQPARAPLFTYTQVLGFGLG